MQIPQQAQLQRLNVNQIQPVIQNNQQQQQNPTPIANSDLTMPQFFQDVDKLCDCFMKVVDEKPIDYQQIVEHIKSIHKNYDDIMLNLNNERRKILKLIQQK